MEFLFTGTDEVVALGTLMLRLVIALGLAAIVGWMFRRYGRTMENRSSLAYVFYFVILTTTLIITIVQTSLAVALGLIGALSIVRFRTPVKEPEELAYLFLSVAIGIGIGAGHSVLTAAAVGFILLVVVGLARFYRSDGDRGLFLSLELPIDGSPLVPDGTSTTFGDLDAILRSHSRSFDVRRFEIRDEVVHATYLVNLRSTQDMAGLTGSLRARYADPHITFIDNSRHMGW